MMSHQNNMPIYSSAMGEAANEYHAQFKYAHALPAQWSWSDLFNAMMAKAAPQSPVAPADSVINALRSADWSGLSIGNKALIHSAISIIETLSAPTASATAVHQVFHSNGSWEDIDADTLANCEDNGVETRTLYTAPTPSTGAADAVMVPRELAEQVIDALGRFTSDEGWGQADMDISDEFYALVSSKKESGDE